MIIFLKFLVLVTIFLSFSVSVEAIDVNPGTLNFGYVAVNTSKSLNVVITNNSGATVDISLSTTEPDVIIEPSTIKNIANGQSVSIAVTLSPTKKKQYLTDIIVNAGNETGIIKVTGNSISQVSFSLAPSNIDFGDLVVGQRKSVSVKITNTSDIEIKRVNITTSSGEFLVQPTSILNIPPSGYATFLVSFVPTTQGIFQGEVYVSADEINSFIPVKGSVSYTSGLTISSMNIDFGVVSVGTSKTETLLVENKGAGTINVSFVVPSGMPFLVSPDNIDLKAGQRVAVNVVFSPQVSGSYRGTLGIISNDKNSPRIDISLKGDTSASMDFLKSIPSSLNFGYVKINSESEKFIRLINNTTTPINVSFSQSDASEFRLTENLTNFNLAPGEARMIFVKFTPKEKKYYSSTFVFTSFGKSYYVSVTGYGDDGNIGIPDAVPPLESKTSSAGGGCSIAGNVESRKDNLSNLLFMIAVPVFIILRKVYNFFCNM
ncbi:MAG: choice-of-anchor D domain-containing protein [Candidatus Micrarchaeia archaeon]